MTYRENLDNDMLFGKRNDPDNQKTFVKPRKNLYFEKRYLSKKDKVIPLKDIVEGWGYDYSKLIKQMDLRVKEGEVGIVGFTGYESDLAKNKEQQRVLDFTIADEITGKPDLVGGIVFQNGKMSFHT